jgi:ribosome modulation factor
MKTKILSSGIKEEQITAFRKGFEDNSHGVKRENCPYEPRDLKREWVKGWDKGERGLMIRLPGV